MTHPGVIPFELVGMEIELSQLLKAVGACDSGGIAKHVVQSGEVVVNGTKEFRRARKLAAGDVVVYRGKSYEVRAAPPS